ncbi:MAG TPA: hypothetical protein VGQ55_00365 [Pyrinomonadaceae bacterium]|jgi:hypothetical protein|nr:hypothetical protein [Pyrinomonadaceae bacterium]
MARVADYAIIADSWVVDGTQNQINFNVPSNIDGGSRCVIGFMMKTDHLDSMTLKLRMNGTEIWNWSWSSGSDDPARFFQEVVAAGVVQPGANVFSFDTSSGDFRFTELSDIVIWFQANT